jgi:hypothetical protein
MNRHQIAAAYHLTNEANRMAALLHDVPMVWQVRQLSAKTVELVGSNIDVERRWFDSSRLFQAFIGPRGRVTISSATDKLYS